MLMMATAGIFRLEQQEFLNLTEIHSVVTSRIVTAVDLNKSDHTHPVLSKKATCACFNAVHREERALVAVVHTLVGYRLLEPKC